MSALYLAADRHVSDGYRGAIYCRLTKTEDAQRIANELKAINIASVN